MILKYLVVIPARSGSKGLPGKNIKNMCGKPMISWTIEHALSSQHINRVVVSTDSEKIAKIALSYGAEVPFLRPSNLAKDESTTESVLEHVVSYYEQNGDFVETVILLQPTSPFRIKNQLNKAILQFEDENSDSLLSVCESKHFFWKKQKEPLALYDYKNRPRRQDILDHDVLFQENGSIYITKKKILMETHNRLGGKISLFIMKPEESIEVDTLLDFKIISLLLKENLHHVY